MQTVISKATRLQTIIWLTIFSSLVSAEETLQQPDDKQPINIQADQLTASETQGKSLYKGNVIISQGSLTLKGDQIEIFHPKGNLSKAVTTGKPAKFKRFNSVENSWINGHANTIEYDTLKKTVLLIGSAQVEQTGKHIIKGPKLFYDISKQTLRAESTPEQQKRVSVTFTPAEPEKIEEPATKEQ
jgi:lipopolysaccharide export system protein LptA